MASILPQQVLEEDLMCPLCLQTCSNPVILSFDHSFCQPCVQSRHKSETGVSSCPQCGEGPGVNLENLVLDVSQEAVQCNHCPEKPLPAGKNCLKCEASKCPTCLRENTENAEFRNHHPIDSITSDLSRWKCTEHQELLKIYCKDDKVCVCTLCTLIGKHKDHSYGSISEGEKELRVNLRDQLQSTQNNIEAVQAALRDLKGKKSYAQDKEQSCTMAEIDIQILKLENLLRKFENNLVDLKRLSNNEGLVFIQIEESSLTHAGRDFTELLTSGSMVWGAGISFWQRPMTEPDAGSSGPNLISRQWEKKIKHTDSEFNLMGERLKEESQPITILPLPSVLAEDQQVKLEDVIQNQNKVVSELSKNRDQLILLYGQRPTLNENTAYPDIVCSPTSVSGSGQQILCLDNPDRFEYYEQVLCTEGRTNGRSYWEVKITEYATWWGIGVSYRSIVRKGQRKECEFGMNSKSWCLYSVEGELSVLHKAKVNYLNTGNPTRVGVYLDFEAGTLSFYSVSDCKVTLIHKFQQQAFTEPLYPALGVGVGTSLSLSF
ncbi:tripartite motif-containing protein 14-like [Heterodontus francisci]|uniref:tripartite motif-containing protein 14-like n=1 Tax=Heterodontus francisci TaxID=7792 RepID=UPI00355C2067